MTEKKRKRRSPIGSVVAIMICFSLLLGTTFAWFTDAVNSVENKIVAGNLDIELEYSKNMEENSWVTVEGSDALIDKDTLWEPGHTEVVYLKITNKGSLALKYNFNMRAKDVVKGETADGKDIYLSQHLKYDVIEVSNAFANRDAARAAVEGSAKVLADYSTEGNMKAGDPSKTVALVVYMPEEVGNEANHKTGTEAPQINLAVTLNATQFTYEEDSFGNQYDKDAEYPVAYDYVVSSSAELVAAFENGGNIQLADNIVLEEQLKLVADKEVYLDMNGKKITVSDSTVDPAFYTYQGSKLTIDGNGTVELENPYMSLMFPAGDVVIENGTFIRNVPKGTPADQVGAFFVGAKVSPWGSSSVVINGGYFDGGYYDENAADIEALLAGTKTLEETADDVAKRGNSKDANKVRVALKNNVQLTLNLSYNLFKIKGGTFVGMNPAWGDEGCMLPITPNYLRPWSYYQGALIEGQTFNENGIVLPEGYSITTGTTEDGSPTYTDNYSK